MKRRFDSFMGPNYETGEIESGIGRITLIEPPYHAKGIERINKKMLELSRQRVVMKEQWQKELRDRNFSVVVESWEKKEKKVPAFLHINWIWYGLFITFTYAACAAVGRGVSSILSNSGAFDSPMDVAKMAVEWVLLGLIVCMLLWKIISKAILHLTPNRSFTTLGKAVCDTLRECGIISAATNVYVEILAKNLKKSLGNMDVVYVHSEEVRLVTLGVELCESLKRMIISLLWNIMDGKYVWSVKNLLKGLMFLWIKCGGLKRTIPM